MAELPRTIGDYDILEEIGRGAMGVVYKARDPSLMRTVALKTMSLAVTAPVEMRDEFVKRFQQEARAAAGLQHPGIVVVYEIGTDAPTGTPYIALELLRGHTLEKLLAEGGRQGWRDALGIVARLAEALQHAHAHGVVHRDLKPANVMILASGEPKIMDFGVAKLETSALTAQGQVFGSPSYMAPEQALGARADAQCDIFSLGCILYELLTGQRAFGGRTVSEIVMRLAHEEPVAPSRLVPALLPALDAVVARALAKDPARRYATAGALAEDVEDLLADRPPRHVPKAISSASPAPAPTPPRAQVAHAPAAAAQSPVEASSTRLAGKTGAGLSLPPGKRISLAFLSGPRSGDVHVLNHPAVLIGRHGAGGGAQVELADSQVSRTHAVLECHGMQFVVRDLESTNGTFVDGQRIREHALEDRGEFQVGASRLMLIVADAE
jgi:serine/threonine-protein kinase